MRTMRKWNYIVSIIMAILGVAILAVALSFRMFLKSGDPGPGFWPVLLGIALVFCSMLLAVLSTVHKEKEEAKEVIFMSPAHARVYKMIFITILFCVALYILGFYIALLIFLPLAMKLMGTKSEKTILVTTVCTLIFIFVAFQIGLKTTMPAPVFFR